MWTSLKLRGVPDKMEDSYYNPPALTWPTIFYAFPDVAKTAETFSRFLQFSQDDLEPYWGSDVNAAFYAAFPYYGGAVPFDVGETTIYQWYWEWLTNHSMTDPRIGYAELSAVVKELLPQLQQTGFPKVSGSCFSNIDMIKYSHWLSG